MFLLAGLGNPGEKYKLTRHNIGFLVISCISKKYQTSVINKKNFIAEVQKSSSLLFVKPQTFMNDSGLSLQAISKYFHIPNDKIIVIHDDLDLPFGAIKFKIGGGSGGHNGLKSIDAHISSDYLRIRIGIGKPKDKSKVISYVLDNFSKEELNALVDIISHTINAIEFYIKDESIEELKSKYTIKK